MINNKKAISLILIICLLFASVGVFADGNDTKTDKNLTQEILNTLKQGLGALTEVLVKRFSDLEGHWALDYIAALMDKGSINGYTDGTFRPNGNITRAEAVKLLITSLGTDPGNADSTEGHWATRYMVEAQKRKYILNDELSNWDKPITRGELARLIIRAIDEDYIDNIDEYSRQIKDFKEINKEIKDYVLKAYVKGIIAGYTDGTFKADNNVTRAETSTMLVRFLDPEKRKVPELLPYDKDFIEPELSIYFYKSKDAYDYFAIMVDNMEDYEGHDEYTFTTECISHPEINYHDRYSKIDGRLLKGNKNMIEWYKDSAIEPDGAIYRLDDFRRWKPAGRKEQFSPKEGEVMKYKITVENGKKTKKYFVELKFKYKEFRY